MTKFFISLLILIISQASLAQSEAEIFSKIFKTKSKWVPTSFIFQNKDIGEASVRFDL